MGKSGPEKVLMGLTDFDEVHHELIRFALGPIEKNICPISQKAENGEYGPFWDL